jgi:hypothetical protein
MYAADALSGMGTAMGGASFSASSGDSGSGSVFVTPATAALAADNTSALANWIQSYTVTDMPVLYIITSICGMGAAVSQQV